MQKLLILFLFFGFSNGLFSQAYTAKVVKKAGRFITQLDAGKLDISLLDRTGLVKEITVGIELWTLMEEPLEKYLFRWKRGSSVYASEHQIYLAESSLSKYPDLLKRYQTLKPSYIKLSYAVNLSLPPGAFLNNLNDCLKYKNLGLNTNEVSAKRVINSNANFLIIGAGKTGNDLTPTSPKTWLHFHQYDCAIDNKTALEIFKNSTAAEFFSLTILEIKVPENEINSIASEFLKRETQDTKPKEESKSNSWELYESKNSDDGWGKQSQSSSGSEPSNNQSQNTSSESEWGSQQSENGWAKTSTTAENDKSYKIEYYNGKAGVISNTGKILIPYNYSKISKYDPATGIAEVEIIQSSKSYTVSCYYEGSVNVTIKKRGYVDQSGQWVIEPVEVVVVGTHYIGWTGISVFTSDCDYDCQQKWKAKWKKEDKECRAEVKARKEEIIQQYRSQGYKVE